MGFNSGFKGLNKKRDVVTAVFKAQDLVGIVDLFFDTVQSCTGRPNLGNTWCLHN